MCWWPGGLHDITYVFPISFTNNSYSFIGLIWLDQFCGQEWTKNISSITTYCSGRHCMGSYAGAFVIGY